MRKIRMLPEKRNLGWRKKINRAKRKPAFSASKIHSEMTKQMPKRQLVHSWQAEAAPQH